MALCPTCLPPDSVSKKCSWSGDSTCPMENFSLSAPLVCSLASDQKDAHSLSCAGQFQWNLIALYLERKFQKCCSESSRVKSARLCSHSWLFPTHPNTCHLKPLWLTTCAIYRENEFMITWSLALLSFLFHKNRDECKQAINRSCYLIWNFHCGWKYPGTS